MIVNYKYDFSVNLNYAILQREINNKGTLFIMMI